MSERGFSNDFEAALSSDTVSLAILVFIDWPDDPLYTWSGVGSVTWDGHTWLGTGDLGHIDKVADSLSKTDTGVELTLDYLNDELRNLIVTNDPVGVDASIYLAIMDGGEVDEAYEIFPGFVDEIEIIDSGESGSIKVRLASELARMGRPISFALSDAHQKDLFPGDRGMEFASRMDEEILWGRKGTQPRTGGGPGNRGRTNERHERH